MVVQATSLVLVTILLLGCAAHTSTQLNTPSTNKPAGSESSPLIAPQGSSRKPGNTPPSAQTGQSMTPDWANLSRTYSCSGLAEAEAYALLSAGHTYLDADGDGHPCEWGPRKPLVTSAPTRSSNCHYVSGYRRKNGSYVSGHTRCR
jgi:hypothetical protein